jgi:ArsR family transcriptional regulator
VARQSLARGADRDPGNPGRGQPGACVCDLTESLGLTQPTISHHLKFLVDAGIFTRDKRGVWAYYALVPRALNAPPQS